jgi:hypothetical protein
MEAQGDDLTRQRNIDFTIVFRDEHSAEQFAKHFRSLGYEVEVEFTSTNPEFPWDVVVVERTIPSWEAITHFEKLLESVANQWGGRNDGWCCVSESSSG